MLNYENRLICKEVFLKNAIAETLNKMVVFFLINFEMNIYYIYILYICIYMHIYICIYIYIYTYIYIYIYLERDCYHIS